MIFTEIFYFLHSQTLVTISKDTWDVEEKDIL